LIIEALEIFFLLLTALMLTYLVRHYIFTVTVLRQANKPKEAELPQTLTYEPTVTILVPARNEEKVIGRLLQRMNELTYPKTKLQVIVINDASTDQTGKIADTYQQNHSFIEVLHRDKFTGGKGKAVAMNHGFSKSKGEIVLCFDADYYPQRDIIEKLVIAFVDPKVGAVQGRVVVLNEPQNTVTRLVALERVGGYRVDQEARNKLGLIAQFGGTVGGFRRSVLESLHGWDETTLAEDTDLTFRIYLAGYIVRYNVDAECYEEAVDTWSAYRRQRYRWAKGHMQCFFKHSWSVLRSKNLNISQKIDGLLLLNVYFMPLLVLVSAIIGLALISSGIGLINVADLSIKQYVASAFWLSFPISCYSFVGNFARFFEVGVGLYLDGRKRSQWLIPLSILTFVYNVPICLVALFDVVISKIKGNNNHVWVKTTHSGTGNHYIENQGISQDRPLWA
jgi:cellulose synthase/poly-beta-1,6-N-acetylglucosamine synthase-like glycosyltransferase